MDSTHETKNFKRIEELNKLYALISIEGSLPSESDQKEELDISSVDLEVYFKSNILLLFGILGYVGFPFKILVFMKKRNCFIVETNNDCLSKLQLIVSNHFPAQCPIDLSSDILNSKSQVKLKLLKYTHSLSLLINDDLVLDLS